jgi:hypothetical protein
LRYAPSGKRANPQRPWDRRGRTAGRQVEETAAMPVKMLHRDEDRLYPSTDAAVTPEAGVAVVPGKPTAAMLAAGARAGGVTVEVAWRVYQAMIQAPE